MSMWTNTYPHKTLEELLSSGNMQSLTGWQAIYVWPDVWSGDLQA